MPEHPESYEEWRDRTGPPAATTRFVRAGVVLAGCLFVANVTGFWPLWVLALPLLVVWTFLDWRRTRRRRAGLEP